MESEARQAYDFRIEVSTVESCIYLAPGARLIDCSGRRSLLIGNDDFTSSIANSVVIDKTMLIADVLDSGYKATLFCHPR